MFTMLSVRNVSMPGVLDNGNEWRRFRTVHRSHPLRSLVLHSVNRRGSRRAFSLAGAGGDHFHCTVESSPGHIRCRMLGEFVRNLVECSQFTLRSF